MFLLQESNGSINSYLWRHIFNPFGNPEWYEIQTVINCGYGQVRISDNQYYFAGNDLSPSDLHFFKVTFGNTIADWGNKMLCPVAKPLFNMIILIYLIKILTNY